MNIQPITKGDIWVHHSERIYRVVTLSNQHATDIEKFPPTVVYEEANNPDRVWSRPVEDFLENFTRYRTPTLEEARGEAVPA